MRPLAAIATISVISGIAIGIAVTRTRPGEASREDSRRVDGRIPSNPTGGPLWDSAESSWERGDLPKAESLFARGEADHPGDAAWPQALAECLAGQGRHEAALQAIERCRAIAPLSAEASSRRRLSRLALGFEKAGTGDPWTARQMADAILQETPSDSMALLLQGYGWAMEGAIPNAERVLQALVAAHPGAKEAYPLLVQCAFRRGDAAEARRWVDALARFDPGFDGLPLLREQLANLESGRGAFSSRLRVICDGNCPLGLEREILDAGERAWTRLSHDLGRAPTSPVSIRIVDGASMPTEWAAAVFDGQVRLPLDAALQSDRRDAILTHELAHAFLVDLSGGRIPLWLNEGLAQWLEGRRPSSRPEARGASWLDELPTRKEFMDLSAEDADLAYSYSLSVTDELMSLHGSTTVVRYLELLAGGVPDEPAFERTFGRTYRNLSERIRSRM